MARVRYIVLTSEWDDMSEPNDSAISSKVFFSMII